MSLLFSGSNSDKAQGNPKAERLPCGARAGPNHALPRAGSDKKETILTDQIWTSAKRKYDHGLQEQRSSRREGMVEPNQAVRWQEGKVSKFSHSLLLTFVEFNATFWIKKKTGFVNF